MFLLSLCTSRKMKALLSSWSDVQSVPENYIFPPGKRPGKLDFPAFGNIPTIDLGRAEGPARKDIVQQVLHACQEFGFFRVINDRVPVSLMDDTMNIFQEFFALPGEYKARFYSTDMSQKCRIYSSSMNYDTEEVHYWRDNFTHHCHPLKEHIELWPDNPTRYREVVGTYSMELRNSMLSVLDLIGEGLGLKPGFFNGELSKIQLLSVNYHIPCPDPSLTLGVPVHTDPNLITMIHQCSVPGLQVFHRGEWLNLEPTPYAFVVIPGLQLKVISNGKFSSPVHRVITNSEKTRTTISSFLLPSNDVIIEPPKVYAGDSPVYRGFTYKEFFGAFIGRPADVALECFKKINV